MQPSVSRQSAEHVSYHCDMNPGRHAFGEALIFAREAAASHQPTERPLHHPSLWHNLETRVGVAAFDHLDFQAGLQLRYMGGKIGATEAAVHIESLQPGGRGQHFLEQLLRAGPFRYVGGEHGHPEHVAEGVDKQEALAVLGLFGAVVSGVLGEAGRADRLAVEDGGRRPAPSTHGLAGKSADLGVHRCEDAVTGPRPKESVDSALGREILWQPDPLTPSFCDVNQGVDDATEAGSWPPSLLGLGEERLEFAPLIVGEIGVANGVFHHLDTRCRGEMIKTGECRNQRRCAI